MLEFRDTSEKNIGRADVLGLVILDGEQISRAVGRPGFDPLFLVRIAFDSSSELCIDKVPTGILQAPYILSPDEHVLTNGEDRWETCRHLDPSQLAELQVPEDKNFWLLEEHEYPDRMRQLTTADRDHIIMKIRKYCDQLTADLEKHAANW